MIDDLRKFLKAIHDEIDLPQFVMLCAFMLILLSFILSLLNGMVSCVGRAANWWANGMGQRVVAEKMAIQERKIAELEAKFTALDLKTTELACKVFKPEKE